MADDGGCSDHEDDLQYIKRAFLQPRTGATTSSAGNDNTTDVRTTVDNNGGDLISLNHNNSRPWYRRHSDAEYSDNESNFFMSEPSMSEADSSEYPLRLLESPFHGESIREDDNLLFLDDDQDDDDGDAYNSGLPPPPPPPPPPQQQHVVRGRLHNHLMAPHSPGNTSLSSWDTSPHLLRRVQVHFSPTRYSDGESTTGGRPSNVQPSQPSQRSTPVSHTQELAGRKTLDTFRAVTSNDDNYNPNHHQDHIYRSNSTSPASEGRMRQLEAFLDDLRENSEGKVQESSMLDANVSFESSLFHGLMGVHGVLRQPPPVEEQNTTTDPRKDNEEQNHVDTSFARKTSNSLNLPSRATIPNNCDDNTLAMILSDSGDEFNHKESNDNAPVPTNDGKDTEISALDETEGLAQPSQRFDSEEASAPNKEGLSQPVQVETKKSKSPEKRGFFERAGFLRRKDRKNNKGDAPSQGEANDNQSNVSHNPKPKHRRQRSGDAAAATMATGSHQWKGMEMDRIPMPDEVGDESDTDAESRRRDGRRMSTGSKPPNGKVKGTIDGREDYDQRKSKQNGENGHDNNGMALKQSKPVTDNDKTSPNTIMNSQASEIAKFSQFALGSAGDDEPMSPRHRPRRIKQRSYRTIRQAAIQGEREDPSSPVSVDPPYSVFFQPPSPQQLQPQQQQQQHQQLQQVPGMYVSPVLSGYMASPSSRKTFSSQQAGLWQQGHSDDYLRPIPPSPTMNVSSSWSSPSPMYQNLPPYIPMYRPCRSYSEMPGHCPTPPPPPTLTFQDPQTLPPGEDFHFQVPNRLAPMFQSDNHQQTNPLVFPRQAHSFDYSPSSRSHDVRSPYDKSRNSPKNEDTPEQDNCSYSNSYHSGDESLEFERNIHRLHEAHYEERVLRQNLDSAPPFSLSQRKGPTKFDKQSFLPHTKIPGYDQDEDQYPTYICPVCNTRQREFFTVSSAPRQFEGPGGFIAFYFAIYVIGSLYIFGLQEGWTKLDCIYFAVITLTTAGLGDFVPTSDGAKIICSIFIYFGVACIGLLLGSYLAGMLDERSHKEAVANQIKACPNCARIQNIKDQADNHRQGLSNHLSPKNSMSTHASVHDSPFGRATKKMRHSPNVGFFSERLSPSRPIDVCTPQSHSRKVPDLQPFESPLLQRPLVESPAIRNQLLASPMTRQILGRQNHTRHSSMDFGGSVKGSSGINLPSTSNVNPVRARKFSMDIPATVVEGAQAKHPAPTRYLRQVTEDSHTSNPSVETPFTGSGTSSEESSTDSSYSDSAEFEKDALEEEYSGVKNAKYIFLTLREALINSMVIIAFGCLGFCLIEGFTVIDSWYFTTVLLTTVGYGDIVPTTEGGKLFATAYLLVAGTILLNNMSMISMIPLELRKRRTEKAVLTQFGDTLDDEALRELATGPVIQRINLASKDSRGLDLCTREMFALAMLIRLGKVTEQDINLTFSAFRKLDVNNDGVLNSKSIIEGMIKRHASHMNLASLANTTNSGRRKGRARHKTQSSRSNASNSSWSGLGAWMMPRNSESTYSGSENMSLPTTNVTTSENAPLMFGSERTPTYGIQP
ncbi:TrkA-N domain containing protein [Nitzschia inconspicua]|uniref:TrkA-N domain containing protein n=1 Tax=Nitzschia inconspicua TaxID=303405 RepID=A0A9K3KTR5_9STRA|nr:TrkA-N domain containing protein [Nitzschia inconspicua]